MAVGYISIEAIDNAYTYIASSQAIVYTYKAREIGAESKGSIDEYTAGYPVGIDSNKAYVGS